jgi:hypothetical protein
MRFARIAQFREKKMHVVLFGGDSSQVAAILRKIDAKNCC